MQHLRTGIPASVNILKLADLHLLSLHLGETYMLKLTYFANITDTSIGETKNKSSR